MGGCFPGGGAPPKKRSSEALSTSPPISIHQIQKMPLKAAHIAKQLVLRMPYPLQIHHRQIK